MIGARRGATAGLLALLAAAPASAIPPPLGPPEPFHRFTYEEWEGTCGQTSACGAKRAWGGSSLVVQFEEARDQRAILPAPPTISWTLYRPCEGGEKMLRGSLGAPLDRAADVAAHLRTAIENEPGFCGPPLDDVTAASVTRLVRMFTLVGGVKEKDWTAPAPFESNRHDFPLNPDVWIDEVADYPDPAKQSRQGGTAVAELMVRTDTGRVVLCTILQSSGVAALDDATCDLLRKRARFEPGKGPPGAGRYLHRTIWDISRIPVPYCTGLRCRVGPDGRVVR